MDRNNFDTVAFAYDKLARSVFGRSIVEAQVCHFNAILPGSNVLVVGGGTGWILDELDKLEIALAVTFAEPSSAMISGAMKRQPFRYIDINFIAAGYDSISTKDGYDVLITNFFLDLFDETHLNTVLAHLHAALKSNGLWLITDFVNTNKLWQRALVKIMYVFFRLTTQIEASRLQDFEVHLIPLNMSKAKEKQFYYGMIKSWLFIK